MKIQHSVMTWRVASSCHIKKYKYRPVYIIMVYLHNYLSVYRLYVNVLIAKISLLRKTFTHLGFVGISQYWELRILHLIKGTDTQLKSRVNKSANELQWNIDQLNASSV